MATTLAVGDKLRVVFGSYYPTTKQLGECVLFYRVVTTALPDAETVALFFKNFTKVQWKNLFHTTVQFAGVSVQKVSPNPKSVPVYSLDGGPGTRSASVGTLPSQCAALIRFRTAGNPAFPAAKAPVGRCYVPFIADGIFDYDDNQLTSGGLSALDALSRKLGPTISSVGSAVDLQQVILSRATLSYTDVASHEVNSFLATQRRRGAYGQLNRPFGT